jgi:5-methylcytosine-specific restriction endonuclease McrA
MPIKAKHGSHWISDKARAAIYARDLFLCAYCLHKCEPGRSANGLSLDHIIPKSKGGSNHSTNLVTAHISCNSQRKNLDLPESLCVRFLSIASKPLTFEVA